MARKDPPKFDGERCRITQFDNKRMKTLGVNERSNRDSLKDAIEDLVKKGLII